MPLSIAHRGASGYEPENTLRAFRKALSLRADMIECDVWLSKDNEVVVMHDENTERTAKRKGKITEMNLKQIKKLNVGKKEAPPTLDEVLTLLKGFCKVIIEIKDLHAVLQILALLEKHQMFSSVILSAENPDVLATIHRHNPRMQTALIFSSYFHLSLINRIIVSRARKVHATIVCLEKALINSQSVTHFHRYGLEVFAWTANAPQEIAFLKECNVDGIISDFPDIVKNTNN